MELEKAELVFYALVAVLGCAGGLGREWLDGRSTSWRRISGRCFAGGIFSFGLIGFWLGHVAVADNGPAYFLGISILIGFFSWEVQQVLRRAVGSVIRTVLKAFGIEVENEEG